MWKKSCRLFMPWKYSYIPENITIRMVSPSLHKNLLTRVVISIDKLIQMIENTQQAINTY